MAGKTENACFYLHFAQSVVLVAAAKIVDEHLLHGFVVRDQDVADGVSADEVADFFG